MSEFLTALDAAATACGALPFEEVIADGTEQATASTVNRRVLDVRSALFDEAEQIINEGGNTQQ